MPNPRRLIKNSYIAIKKCRHGLMAYNTNDTFVGRSLDQYGEWCQPELDVMLQILKSGDVVIDVGAYIGTHTLAFAQKVGTSGLVYAFEPQRHAFQLLCANMALNGILTAHCSNLAISDKPGTIRVPMLNPEALQNFGAFNLEGHEAGDLVRVTTLDAIDIPDCQLLKVDVERMEPQVIRGAQKTIEKFRPVMYIENNLLETSSPILRILKKFSYQSYWHISPYFNPGNYFANRQDIFSTYRPEVNLLCLPEERALDIEGFEPVEGSSDNWQKAYSRILKRQGIDLQFDA